jgi:hypothetical protein
VTETSSTKPADALRVPSPLLPIVEPMGQWIDTFCHVYLDEEYTLLSRKMLAKLARKRPSPLDRGDLLIWAASVVYTVGLVNFLTDPTQSPHLTLDQFSEASGVTKSSLARKSRLIADAINTGEFDPEFCRRDVAAQSSAPWMIRVDGFIVDARMLPPEVQAEARRRGLIPDLDEV